MLKIRLTRRGKKNKAFFRLVVAEHTAPVKGKFIEALGFLNPHSKEKSIEADRVKYWLEKGAQCSSSAHNLLVREEIIKGPKRAIKIGKKKKKPADNAEKKEGAKEEEKQEAEAKKEVEEIEEKAGKKEEQKPEKSEDKGTEVKKKDNKKAEKEQKASQE